MNWDEIADKELNIKWKEIPKYGDMFQLEEFIEACKCNAFIDEDGYGYYSDGILMSDIIIVPSDIVHGTIDYDFSHVIWFNR